jgi:hypothetical protein
MVIVCPVPEEFTTIDREKKEAAQPGFRTNSGIMSFNSPKNKGGDRLKRLEIDYILEAKASN